MRQKRVPLRMCLGCSLMKPKKELIRVVRAPGGTDENGEAATGEISIDTTGRKPGRGAYVCNDINCLRAAIKAKRLEKAFSCRISPEIYESLQKEMGSVEEKK